MWFTLNDETMQHGSLKTVVYGVRYLVSYLSQFMSLQPGDIISTGAPPGVGKGMKPPFYLKVGDVGFSQCRSDKAKWIHSSVAPRLPVRNAVSRMIAG